MTAQDNLKNENASKDRNQEVDKFGSSEEVILSQVLDKFKKYVNEDDFLNFSGEFFRTTAETKNNK